MGSTILTKFEAALVRVKGLLRDKGKDNKPTCFISYAWGVPEHERWVLQLAKDLRNSEIDVLLDRWHSLSGSNLDLYIERIVDCDFVIAVGTPKLKEKYISQESDPVVAAELKLINLRVRQPNFYGETVIPVLLDGNAATSFTPQLQPLVSVDFREVEYYFLKLFDTIWHLHGLSFENPLLEDLRASMSPGRYI
ncbi:MAG: toll/interleukin-1 receptor domain-containing protein [Saprospiraceae bacterium]